MRATVVWTIHSQTMHGKRDMHKLRIKNFFIRTKMTTKTKYTISRDKIKRTKIFQTIQQTMANNNNLREKK